MSKSILYLGGFELPDKNAAAQRVMANAKLLREMGFEVSFKGISKDIKNASKVVDGFVSNPVPYPTGTKQWMHQIFTFVESKVILERKPDYVVLYNFPAVASLRILRICHKNGIKVVHDLTEWESNNRWSPADIIRKLDINLRMRYCMKKMDGVIAISRYLYEHYKDYTNTILVPPTVDLTNPKFCRERTLTASDKQTKLVYAGSTGTVATKDRLDFIIKEINELPNVQLDIVGQTKEQFQAVFGGDIAIKDNIIFHGRVSHEEAVQYVCNADFQMLIRENSLKNKAGFPTKFVESFSCCTPLIATVSSNICDYLKDGFNGLLVSEIHLLGEALRKAVQMSVEEKIKMKEACRSFTGFNYHSYKEEFDKIFK
ncbi:glycosyltransferase family 4 protein [Bacteroides thetaiotaomicron]|uniref:glycosyltransferase family 4 protein n=1 Tax=Bacteroides thetaiotaomicron TaxID=818 RepID=UPI00216582C1|nr:glycosyltransferase family 4 protein [Bacteroides thetaiotaomicron]MCS2715188.1 glycosyltransferase family 4 protein [Bacteroides thetaiotaomicron]MCS2875485.1 glycosyltransferase family 4 protein [Bacteroides thetaiotaomicron]